MKIMWLVSGGDDGTNGAARADRAGCSGRPCFAMAFMRRGQVETPEALAIMERGTKDAEKLVGEESNRLRSQRKPK
jgi:hypothetical protein